MKLNPIERAEMKRFPPSTLYDIARNGNARWEARKQAYLFLLDRGHPLAKHENLQQLAYMVAEEIMSGKPATPEAQKPPESGGFDEQNTPSGATLGPSEFPLAPDPAEWNGGRCVRKVESAGPFQAGFTTKNQLQDEVLPTVDIRNE